MKKSILLIIFTLLINILGLTFTILLTQANNQRVYVDDDNTTGPWDGTPQHPYQNITSALRFASDGDIIFVNEGIYYERFTIDKSISLIGQNKSKTIIDGNRTGTIIEIEANDVKVSGFTIKNSGLFHYLLCGVYIKNLANIIVSNNILIYNYKGIRIINSNNSIFSKNTFIENLEAIYLINSHNNIIIENSVLGNQFAMVLDNSNNNTAFHNNFINNTHTISSINSINYWDNSVEGNYWSKYKGEDENKDGIGDSAYIIATDNTDNYPLMGIFTSFQLTYENKTIYIPTICNSTISNFKFNKTLRMLNFKVTDIPNATGFCRISIPGHLIHKPYIVFIDEQKVNATVLSISNTTHTLLYLAYNLTISPREVKIFSKFYYKLFQEYNTLLKDFRNLNSTYYELLANYDSLNQTYQQTLINYSQLQTNYNSLNQTYQQTLINYQELMKEHNLLNQTHNRLLANYTKLQKNYNSIQADYNALLEEYSSLKSAYTNTRATLLFVSLAAIVITSIASSLTIKYHKENKKQKKLVEKYKNELERISLLERARKKFETDVQRRREKIEKFERKYGITVRPRSTLEDVIRSLELKEKKEVKK